MATPKLYFNKKDQPEFFKELSQRVNQYFSERNISRYGNWRMVLKTVFMLALYFTPFILMLSGVFTSFWPVLGLWVIMGFGMAGLGLSVMHDANHGSYSRSKRVNKLVGFVIHFIGGYHANWKIQHNVLHHSFTNVHGMDDDINLSIMRFSPDQEWKPFFRFQAFYAPFLYGLLTLNWFFVKDFEQIARYRDLDLLKSQGLTYRKALTEVIIHKLWYFGLMIVLPLLLVAIPWWQTLIGFFVMHFICGQILSLIFQPAHVLEETSFYKPDDNNSVENNWAIHQVRTTSNFANGSRWFSWYVGGLNNQIEHHLFPNICHIHYRKLSKIVKETTAEFGLPYHQHKTFFAALRSHFSLLHALGTRKYDLALSQK
ncbi:MAG: acyl-CoA desaturase [Bacteroidetes bacterium]|nr:acyl-CoA desaturase [Bacteroidota bacterium]